MMEFLRRTRLTWGQFGVVAALSALATGLVIAAALGQPGTQSWPVAQLSRRVVVHRHIARTTPAAAPVESRSPQPSSFSSASGGDSSNPTAGGSTGPAPPTAPSPGNAAPIAAVPVASPDTAGVTGAPAPPVYKVKHVFVIALSVPNYASAFGAQSVATYLNRTLRPKGTLLAGYQTLGGPELPDYLAMISGQAPNPDTLGDCASYLDFPTGSKPGSGGLVPGTGCVYPNTVLTIGDQVTAAGGDWRAYIQGMGHSACVHPNAGAVDNAALPFAGPEYDTRHNPFIYFHSLLDLGDCGSDDLDLARLGPGLAGSTPRYSFIAPDACGDAATVTCAGGTPGGLAAEDAFLKAWVPKILASRAYRQSGVIVIAFAASTPAGTAANSGPVRTGALVLSPFAKAGSTLESAYNAYSLLRTTETLLGLKALGRAAEARPFITAALPGA